MSLREPLPLERIEAAGRVYALLTQWRQSDESLRALKSAFPDFSSAACVLKVVAINGLYGTNVYATLRMADHVRDVLNDKVHPRDHVQLVERIADLRPRQGDTKRHHASFASKFVHFFVDEDAPIFDSYAEKALKSHLGRRRGIWNAQRPYESFVRNSQLLRAEASISVSARELDKYLWLLGQAREWQRLHRSGAKITTNRELADMFQSPTPRVEAELSRLLGESWIKDHA